MNTPTQLFIGIAARIALRDHAKAIRRARYQRYAARNRPVAPSPRYPAELRLSPAQRAATLLPGVPEYLQQIARMRYGNPGTWGQGKYVNGTKKGPGRRRIPLTEQSHPAGTKLVRRFIRDAQGENVTCRMIYAALTGKQYGVVEAS